MNNTQKQNILNLYPNTTFYDDYLDTMIDDAVHAIIYYDDLSTTCIWDNKYFDYTNKIKLAAEYVKTLHNNVNKPLEFLNFIVDDINRSNMIDNSNYTNYDGSVDKFWSTIKEKYKVNTNREIHIVTWGTTFILEPPKKCQLVYNAKVLRGHATVKQKTEKEESEYKLLIKLKGTNLKIQSEVRTAKLFEQFIENIVKDIEQNNFTTIGIFCSRGCHRSVACAEMLINLYPNRTINHLTIDM